MSEDRSEYLGLTGFGHENLAQSRCLDIRMDADTSRVTVTLNEWYATQQMTTAGSAVAISLQLRYREWRALVDLAREASERVQAEYRGRRSQVLAENRFGKVLRSSYWVVDLVVGAATFHLGYHAKEFMSAVLRADRRIEKRIARR